MIPGSYEEWRSCIVEKCGIPLSKSFAESRLEALRDSSSPATVKFRNLYGDAYWQQVLAWFEKALVEAR